MDTRRLTADEERTLHAPWAAAHAEASLWQSPGWAAYQRALGREVRVYGAMEKGALVGGAQVVIDATAGGLSTWDMPRGPIGEGREALLQAIAEEAARERCLAMFCSPPLPLAACAGWRASGRHEQPEATRIIDLTLDDNALLAHMKPKGRYNISVAQRYDLEVRHETDIPAFHALLQNTGGRDGFRIGAQARYEAFLRHVPGAFLLLCYHPKSDARTPVAGLLGVVHGTTGIYYYGASAYEQRQLMAPYLLQWEALLHCRKAGCLRYDLLGIAPPGAGADHPWAGISAFKEKFGGTVVTYPPERQLIFRPWLWRLLQAKRRILG